MSIKLIDKTTRTYLVISLSVLLISMPFFYFVVQNLWIEDVDDSLLFQKQKIVLGIEQHNLSDEAINDYTYFGGRIGDEITIMQLPSMIVESDSIYYSSAYDSVRGHVEPFRELRSYQYINNKPYQITLQRDLVESEDLVWGIVVLELIVFCLLIVLMIFISIRYFRKIWNPFYEITNQLKRLNLHENRKLTDVDCKGIYEFEDLKASANELIERNYTLFQLQKEFAENAAHEMQTPLAVIKSQISLLVNTEISEKQFEYLSSIDKNIKHQSQLVKGLLMLSKLENNQFSMGEKIDVKMVVDHCFELVKEELQLCSVPIDIAICHDTALKNSNLLLFTMLVSGLLNNSIKHGAKLNTIKILLTEQSLQLSNLSIERPLDGEKIFQRFYKEISNSAGTGLGLSIVSQICTVLNYSVEYSFTAPNTHTFSIYFQNISTRQKSQ